MRVFHSLSEIPSGFGPTIASIGSFDGVHRGHRLILDAVARRAKQRSMRSIAVTFEPHPLRILRPEAAPKLITPAATRLELLQTTGIDAVLALGFTAALSRMSGVEFVTTILHDGLRAAEVHEGPNFRFGHRAEAGLTELQSMGRGLGFDVIKHPACEIGGRTVSSSAIRDLIGRGETSAARRLLGYSFFIQSTPVRGRGMGAALNAPTINLAPYPELLPAHGVYVSRMSIAGKWFDSVTNVGVRPTFGKEPFAVESYLFDFQSASLSAETPLILEFHRRLREERRFPSPEALKEQIARDSAQARRYHRLRRLFEREDSAPPCSRAGLRQRE